MSDVLYFKTRSSAESAVISSSVDMIAVTHGMALCFYERAASGTSTALTTSSGGGLISWKPSGTSAYLEHWGILPSYGLNEINSNDTDYTNQVRNAFSEFSGEILLTGYTRISNSIPISNGRIIRGVVKHIDCGFSAFSMNANATGFLVCDDSEPGPTLECFSIWADQANGVTNRASLKNYPAGIDARETARGHANLLRFIHLNVGMQMSDDNLANSKNAGGWDFGTIEFACFDIGIQIENTKDFVNIDRLLCYPYHMNSVMKSIFYDGSAYALKVRKADNLNIETLATFRARVKIGQDNDVSNLPVMIANIALDGNNAGLDLEDGCSLIGNLYTTSDNAQSFNDINCTGGDHSIANVRIWSAKENTIRVDGGELRIGGGRIERIGTTATNKRSVYVTGGRLTIDDVTFDWVGGSRSRELVLQQAPGQMIIRNSAQPVSDPGGLIVKFADDVSGNACDLTTMRASAVSIPAGSLGRYNV